jgi:hypothetical protein
MEDILGIILFRTLIRTIGQYTRYFYFWLIGRKRSLKSLSYESKDEYKDLGKELTQGFFNGLVGAIVLGLIVLIIVSIIFS